MHLYSVHAGLQRAVLHAVEQKRVLREARLSLIKDLTKVSPYIEKNIFRSVENVNLDTVIAYKQYGVKHNFLERYDEMGRLNGASGSQTADDKEME